jgi:methylmalonyl-CoA epimerase
MTGSNEFEIDHLGIAVRSVEEALVFYRDRLGMNAGPIDTVAAEKVRVAMLQAGASRLELLAPSEPDSTIAKFIDKRGPGLHHVALRVQNFEETVERLRSTGAPLLNEPRAGAGGHIYVFLHPSATGGVLLELIKAEDNS